MSKTNTALRAIPENNESLAQRLKELRDQAKDIDDEIKFYSTLLQEKAAAAGTSSLDCGGYRVNIIAMGRDNFSLGEAKKRMNADEFAKVIAPFVTHTEYKRVDVKVVDMNEADKVSNA